jgi:hypothetical protein
MSTQRAIDLDLNKAHSIFYFRFNEEKPRRELRIVKMGGCDHHSNGYPLK